MVAERGLVESWLAESGVWLSRNYAEKRGENGCESLTTPLSLYCGLRGDFQPVTRWLLIWTLESAGDHKGHRLLVSQCENIADKGALHQGTTQVEGKRV